MAKLRLTQAMRTRLRHLANKVVSCPTERATLTAAYKTAAVAVRKAVEKSLPPADMKVLRKYDQAAVDDCIRLNLTAGGVVVFRFDEDTGPVSIGCRIFLADEQTTAAYNSWKAADDTWHKALRTKLSDYDALIDGATYYQDVVEVWPEAEQLRTEFGGGSLIAFSPDVVARIRADVKTRAKAA